MAKGYGNLIDMEIDFNQLAEFSGFVDGFTTELNHKAFKAVLADATYEAMTEEFDKWMSVYSVAQKEHYTHVYEYAINGDPYRHVGDNKFKLWRHMKGSGPQGSVIASFMFLPAKNRIPTPRQRRSSRVGQDPIRKIAQDDFEKLMEKTNGIRRTLVWKAPLNEYSIARRVTPVDAKWLFLANTEFLFPMTGAAGAGWRFTKSYIITQDPPGYSAGMFTAAWTTFWSIGMSQEKFDRLVGAKAAEIVEDGLESISVTKSRRKTTTTVGSQTNFEAALRAGKAQARNAVGMTTERLKSMNAETEWLISSRGGL